MDFPIDRNPSPPPELLEKDGNFVPDRIGRTVYSKRWLYNTLMNMLKVVHPIPSTENKSNENISLETEQLNNYSQNVIELDPEIEQDACTLWDMSANREVAVFLCEFNVAEIFLEIIELTNSPRLLEIVVGILGNMSSFSATCEYISKNITLVQSIVMLTGCTDSCTLVQLFRLLSCGIVRKNCFKAWFQVFKENEFFMENLKSVLQNNMCREVLCGLLEFLSKVLPMTPSFCSVWSEQSYSLAIIECGKTLEPFDENEDLDIYFTVLNTLCQDTCNLPAYGKQFEALRPQFHAYFAKLGEEPYLPDTHRVSAIISSFALYGNLLFSGYVSSEYILFDDNLFQIMLNLCKMVKSLLVNLKTNKDESFVKSEFTSMTNSTTVAEDKHNSITMAEDKHDESSFEKDASKSSLEEDASKDVINRWQTLIDVIVHTAKACSKFTSQESQLQVLEEIITIENH